MGWGKLSRRYALRFAAVLTVIMVSFLGATASPHADAATAAPQSSNYQFSVEPFAAAGSQQRSDFSYELQPGHSVLDQVVILNNSPNPEAFNVYPEDAVNVSGTGGFGFQQQGKIHNTTVGKWLTIGQTTFTIPAIRRPSTPFSCRSRPTHRPAITSEASSCNRSMPHSKQIRRRA